MTKSELELLFQAAERAGMAAGKAAVPTPMIVVQHRNPFDDSSEVIKQYAPIMDGVCGFAWINIRPGTCAAARYAKETHRGRRDSYAGGVSVHVGAFGQSLERKAAYARAYAKVLRDAGIQAYSRSRID